MMGVVGHLLPGAALRTVIDAENGHGIVELEPMHDDVRQARNDDFPGAGKGAGVPDGRKLDEPLRCTANSAADISRMP